MSFGATQDLTGFTETDPNARISVTASRATAANLTRQEDAFVYKDKGVGWFAGDFKHRLAVRVTAANSGGWLGVWALANNVDDAYWLQLNAQALLVNLYYDGANYQLRLREAYGGEFFTATYNISLNTTYYLELERLEGVGTYGTLYCRIYSDAGYTSLLTTLSLTLHVKADFRYLFALLSYNSASAQVLSGYSESLDLNERWGASGRGAHALTTARSQAGRGRSMAIYAAYGGSGRGAASAYNSFGGTGQGQATITASYGATGRGQATIAANYGATGRGHHLAQNTFGGSGRGKFAICGAYGGRSGGAHRAANATLARYELYVGIDGAPDFTAAPFETFTTLPHATAALDPAPAGTERTYHLVLRARNAYNLASRNVAAWTVTVDDAGAQVITRPSAPTDAAAAAAAGGKVLVTARYEYAADGADQATQWLIYLRSNGTSPDPTVDTPTVVTMAKVDGVAKLSWLSAAQADGATIKVIVRARRVDTVDAGPPPVTVNADSANVDVHQATVDTDGPAQPTRAGIYFAALYEQPQ